MALEIALACRWRGSTPSDPCPPTTPRPRRSAPAPRTSSSSSASITSSISGCKLRAHRVALLRAVQLHPGDAVLEFDLDVVAPRDRSLRRICLIRHRPCLQRPARASHRRLPYIRYPFIMAAVGQSTDAVRVSAAMETTGAGTLYLVHLLTHASRAGSTRLWRTSNCRPSSTLRSARSHATKICRRRGCRAASR